MPGFRSTLNTGYFRLAGDGISVQGDSGEAAESWLAFGANTIANAATSYLQQVGGADAVSTTTLAQGQWIAPFAGKLEAMYYHAAAAGSGQYDFILQVAPAASLASPVDSALALTNFNLANTTGNVDAGTQVSFNKGDGISIKCNRDSYTSTPTRSVITMRIRPP